MAIPVHGLEAGDIEPVGKPFTEPTLIKVASGYEAVTHHRKAPASTPALPGETISY